MAWDDYYEPEIEDYCREHRIRFKARWGCPVCEGRLVECVECGGIQDNAVCDRCKDKEDAA